MEKVLLIIDMQEMYVGRGRNKKIYPYKSEELIEAINKRIADYKPEEVFYVQSIAKGLGGLVGSMPKADSFEGRLVEKLKIVSKNIYTKSKPDAFTNDALGELMRARNVKEVEICGVDGATSAGASAVGAFEYELKVIYNENCIATLVPEKAVKYREKLTKGKCTFWHY